MMRYCVVSSKDYRELPVSPPQFTSRVPWASESSFSIFPMPSLDRMLVCVPSAASVCPSPSLSYVFAGLDHRDGGGGGGGGGGCDAVTFSMPPPSISRHGKQKQ